MFKTKKEMIENEISKLKNINSMKKIELQVFLKDGKFFTVPSNLQVNQKSPTKKEVIRRMCRSELFNRHSDDDPIQRDLSIENIDHIELKEIKEEKKCKQYKTHDYITNAELNRMYK